jgi:hypothetical protein
MSPLSVAQRNGEQQGLLEQPKPSPLQAVVEVDVPGGDVDVDTGP